MAIAKEQCEQIKLQIIEQINKWDVDDAKKENARIYIKSLDECGLEEFLKKNKIIKKSEEVKEDIPNQECIFCLILQRKIPSYKIGETKDALAVLEIKPVSNGHVIVIPKSHVPTQEISHKAFEFALEISQLIKRQLKPKEITISTSTLFGHTIVNVIPVYGNETGERKNISKQELEKLKEILTIKTITEKKENSKSPEFILKRKIP